MKTTKTKTIAEMEAFAGKTLERSEAVHEVRGVWYPVFNHEGTELQFYELDATPDMAQ